MEKTVRESAPVILCENHGRNEEVLDLLDSFGYWQLVVAAPHESPRSAPWNAHVLAGPETRRDLYGIFASLPSSTPR
jgi:hypothetical protein